MSDITIITAKKIAELTGNEGGGGTTPPASGDMKKTTYDTDNDGVVDAAESVPWSGITGKPTFGDLAAQATKLQTPRTITLAGSVVGTTLFDGSANVVIFTTGSGGSGTPSLYANVKEFGAVGDNVANDTQAIKNALTYLATLNAWGYDGGVLFFPKGIYRVEEPITARNVILKGESEQVSIIHVPVALGAGVPAITLSGNRGFLTGMEDIALRCGVGARAPMGSKNHNCDGVYTQVYCFLNRVSISNFDMGFTIDGASHVSVSHCHIQDNYFNVYFKHDEGDSKFDMCVLDGSSKASIGISGDHEGHPTARFVSCHVGFGPFGVYQEARSEPPLPNYESSAMLVEWVFDGCKFEAIGNAAIYAEDWNKGTGKGLINCTFRNVGFAWNGVEQGMYIPAYPRDYPIYVGYCGGTNIYEPGISPFRHISDPNGFNNAVAWNIDANAAFWMGAFKFTDFVNGAGGGYQRIYGQVPMEITTADSRVTANMICDPVNVKDRTVRRIIIYLEGFSNGTGPAIAMTFPAPFNVAPKIKFNGTGIPDSGVTVTTTGCGIITGDVINRNGIIELVGW